MQVHLILSVEILAHADLMEVSNSANENLEDFLAFEFRFAITYILLRHYCLLAHRNFMSVPLT